MVDSGIVKAVTGSVKAIAADGTERILRVGHGVLPSEQIITGNDGTITVGFSDGTMMDLGRSSVVTLEEALISDEGNKQSSPTLEYAQGEVAAIQQTIADDEAFDPSKLDAPAAGAVAAASEAENGGSTTVQIDYLNPTMTPENGFDTIGINVIFPEPIEELIQDPDQSAPLVGKIEDVIIEGVINATDSEVDESSGINTIVSGALNIDGSAPQDVSLLASDATWDAANKALIADDNSYRIDINNDGTYNFTLLNALNHPAGQGESNRIDFNISAELTSDSGSIFNTSFIVSIFDDGPVVNNTQGSINNNVGEVLEGLIDYDLGLDGLGSIDLDLPTTNYKGVDWKLTSMGDNLSFAVTDNDGDKVQELHAFVDKGSLGWDGVGGPDRSVFTLQAIENGKDDSAYKLVMHDVLDMPGFGNNSASQNLDIQFGFTVTDNDSDSVSSDFTVTVGDAVNTAIDTTLSTLLIHPDSVDLTA